MKTASPAENENVIQVAFGANSHEISHPASKNYPLEEELEDPLEALLAEGMLEDEELEAQAEEDYIHAHQRPLSPTISYQATASEMAASAIDKLKRLKEDSKRLRYYLDELSID